MTTNKASHASGAAISDQDTRRRNVLGQEDSNGSVTAPQREIDDKKAQKVQCDFWVGQEPR